MSGQALTLFDLVSNIEQWKEKFAVVFDEGQGPVFMTYNQVMVMARKVCNVVQNHTHSPEIVGLCLDPSQFVPAIILGVLKSENAFLNFLASSLGYVQSVLDKQQVNILLIQSSKLEMLTNLFLKYNAEIVNDDMLRQMDITLVKLAKKQEVMRNRTSLAYCITTSGTTGSPKIVKVPNECIIPNIILQRKIFKITEVDVVFLSSPLTFDPSIVDIFVTLSSGACLLITSDVNKTIPQKLLKILTHYNVTVLQCTPTLISRFNSTDLKTKLLGRNSSLRVLGLGGEKFPSLSLLNQWRSPGNTTEFYNLYGITEVSCWSSIYKVTENVIKKGEEDIPIGIPMTDTVFVVKDSERQIVTKGNGLLYIGSSKRVCYINDEDPHTIYGEVLRSTGDIVHVNGQGDIFYIGRADNQIKRNGKRIDLTEIEQVIYKVPGVIQCKVLYKEEVLIAVIVQTRSSSHTIMSHPETPLSPNVRLHRKDDILSTDLFHAVTKYVQNHLPVHSWPDRVFQTEVLPMTKHGKCDVDALWEIDSRTLPPRIIDSCQDIENNISDMWKDTIGIKDEIKDEAVFVLSGGDSVRALQLANQIEDYMNIQLPWLLDFILHKSFSDILIAVKNVLEERRKNYDHTKCSFITQNENIDGMLVPQNSKKRKYGELEGYEKFNLFENLSFSNEKLSWKNTIYNSASIKITMRSVSKCNSCSDWLIHTDETLSNFNYCSHFLPSWRKYSEKIVQSEFKKDSKPDQLQTILESNNEPPNKRPHDFSIKVKWKYNTGKCVDASPLITSLRDNRMVVFIGSHSHRFSAVLFDTGQLLWEITLSDRIESSACVTMCGTFVVVGCYDYNLYAVNSMTGDVWWKYKVGGEVKSSPIVDPITSLVIFGSHDQCIHAVNIKTKTPVWCTDIGGGSLFASPCVSLNPHAIFCATLGGVIAALKGDTGTLLWTYKCEKPVFSSPTVTHEGICCGCVDGKIYHLNFSGDLIWKFTTDAPIFCTPTVVDNKIFIGSHDCHMYCVSTNGKLIWKVKLQSAVYSSGFSFIFDNLIYSRNNDITETKQVNYCINIQKSDINLNDNYKLSPNIDIEKSSTDNLKSTLSNTSFTQGSIKMENGNKLNIDTKTNREKATFITFASTDGNLYIVNVYTGEITMQYELPGELFSSPVVYEDCIIIGCRNDFVYSLKLE